MILEYFPDGWEGGPLILLHSGAIAEVRELHGQVCTLASDVGSRIAIHALPFVTPVGECRLVAISAANYGGVVQHGNQPEFEWILPPRSWETVGLKLESFCEPGPEGFQYLSNYGEEVQLIYSTSRTW